MRNKIIRVVHFIKDDKFTDGVISCFEKDQRFENKYFLVIDTPDYCLKFIRHTGITLLSSNTMVKEVLKKTDYDVVFFFSLPNHLYSIFKYIPKHKIVIWWSWGYDLYGPDRYLIFPLYKPLTQQYCIHYLPSYQRSHSISLNNNILTRFIKNIYRKQIIHRVDYFQPVLRLEFEMMKKKKYFKAKEFYYPNIRSSVLLESTNNDKAAHGGILIGNSASETNNHLDVWRRVKDFVPEGTKVTFPLNYGDTEYADYLESVITEKNVVFLRQFLPLLDYSKIIDSCSYAIFGALRQQAIANLCRCFANGIKVFLYKDSITYKFFSGLGFIVFTIEDIDINSFVTPLSKEEAKHNINCLQIDTDTVKAISERSIQEIIDLIS